MLRIRMAPEARSRLVGYPIPTMVGCPDFQTAACCLSFEVHSVVRFVRRPISLVSMGSKPSFGAGDSGFRE